MNDTGLEPVLRRLKGGVLGRTLVIQIVAPCNLRNHTSNVTRYGRKMTTHYNFFTAKSGGERVGFDSNKACKAGPLRGPDALYILPLHCLVRRDGFEPSSILIKSQVLYRLATDALMFEPTCPYSFNGELIDII